jgi:hypothetical protein
MDTSRPGPAERAAQSSRASSEVVAEDDRGRRSRVRGHRFVPAHIYPLVASVTSDRLGLRSTRLASLFRHPGSEDRPARPAQLGTTYAPVPGQPGFVPSGHRTDGMHRRVHRRAYCWASWSSSAPVYFSIASPVLSFWITNPWRWSVPSRLGAMGASRGERARSVHGTTHARRYPRDHRRAASGSHRAG